MSGFYSEFIYQYYPSTIFGQKCVYTLIFDWLFIFLLFLRGKKYARINFVQPRKFFCAFPTEVVDCETTLRLRRHHLGKGGAKRQNMRPLV